MRDFSILIAGKAGFGIDKSGLVIGRILNRLCYRLYIWRDYPSLIRGGHTFSIIRAAEARVASYVTQVDFILALNQDAVNLHKHRLKDDSIIIYDPDAVKPDGLGPGIKTVPIPIGKIIKEENASEIMLNSCIIGALCRAAGIKWGRTKRCYSYLRRMTSTAFG